MGCKLYAVRAGFTPTLLVVATFIVVSLAHTIEITTTQAQTSNEFQDLIQNGVNLSAIMSIFSPVSDLIENEQCRQDSLTFLHELHRFTLWATQMFDASVKFPNGVLYGSTYDMGNFDECLQVAASDGSAITGKYCLARVRITPTDALGVHNDSAWRKIETVASDPARTRRDEVHWAFCIPSSCGPVDLRVHLEHALTTYTEQYGFSAQVQVDEDLCQVATGFDLSIAGIVLCAVVAATFLIVSASTVYDLLLAMRWGHGMKLKSNVCHNVVMSFSAVANVKKLLAHKKNPDGLDCIHGLKLVSVFLIIMGHRLMFNLGAPLINTEFIEGFYGRVDAMILLNGPIVVDTFFTISGFLVCYLLLQEFARRKGRINFLALYIHRYVRLTPVYMVVLGVYATLLGQLGSGPLWQRKVGTEVARCGATWWANLLYINNYVSTDKLCMFQSWYITCDMHLFILSPPIVWLLWKRPNIGKVTLGVATVISVLIAFFVTYLGKLDALLLLYMDTLSDPIANETFRNMYIPTHTRASPYFIGMAAGYLRYLIKKNDLKMPKIGVWFGWLVALIFIEGTVFSAWVFYLPGRPYNALGAAFYGAFHRIAWSVGTSWLILAVSTGNGAFMEPILTWRPVVPLSRLTYCAFLAHGGLQLYSVASSGNPFYGSIYNLVWFTCGDIVLSFLAALALSLLFESPILGLEKIFLRGGGGSTGGDASSNSESRNSSSTVTIPVDVIETVAVPESRTNWRDVVLHPPPPLGGSIKPVAMSRP